MNFLFHVSAYYYVEYTYYYLAQLILVVFIISAVLVLLAYLISDKNLYYEKISGYECGFDPFSDAREPFSIKFYLISILFILFDIELIYFFPWVCLIKSGIEFSIFFVMYLFFLLLIVGFYYE